MWSDKGCHVFATDWGWGLLEPLVMQMRPCCLNRAGAQHLSIVKKGSSQTLWPASTEKVLLTEARTRPFLRGTTVAGSRGELAGDGDESWVLRGGGVDASREL